MSFRIAQISDPHLSAAEPRFDANFSIVAAHLRAAAPDLVIDTGDVSLDGADSDADLAHARAAHEALGLPWRALPGNHDVGDNPPDARQPANAARRDRWLRYFGEDRFAIDVPGWRIIGLDSQIMGSAMQDEQFAFLETALADAGGRAIALFLHKPLFLEDPADAAPGYWYVPHAPRSRLLAAFGARPPALIGSGHVHQYREARIAGTHHAWAPAIGFIVGDAWQAPIGAKLLGHLIHDLHPDGTHSTRVLPVEGLGLHDIGLMPEVYGPLAPLAPVG